MGREASCDIAIVGGGLAGGLIALALRRNRPEAEIRLIEEADALGGNHIWSFFASDVDAEGAALLDPLVDHRWDGYSVRFPGHERALETPYRSVTSTRFDAAIREALPERQVRLGTKIIAASPNAVVLGDGTRIEAGGVIDCRGAGDLTLLDCGWQKFVGLELELARPHGVERPVVMDASVEQIDGYRFVYLLPFGERRIFVEDTYYSEFPMLAAPAVEQRIRDYAAARGWEIASVGRRETGVLPVAMGGDFDAYWRSGGKAAKAGMRAALFHPTTGYTLPDAVRTAQYVAGLDVWDGAALESAMRDYARTRWNERRFYRMLNAMLFRGAGPDERRRIFERFYRLDSGLVGRFYAASSPLRDKARVLMGKPPIPVSRGLKALWESRSA